MLNTNVKEIKSPAEYEEYVNNNDSLVICAGRLGPMCIPVYIAMEQMEKEEQFKDVKLLTVDFDTASALAIRRNEKCRNFMGLPFTAYYKNGKMVHATSSIQSRMQLENNIKEQLL
ncbi:MAG: thioredoxin family protein [Clostridiales bacterium]|nr:thioredoxin family protein [Clostridiales bacterium]